MSRLPVVIPISGVSFEDAAWAFSDLEGFFSIDARRAHPSSGRCSIVSALPTSVFSMAGAFVTVDGHTTIDNPCAALTRFCGRAATMSSDPYLAFSGGIAGYIGFEGARAIRGLAPARGFSRHSQCRLGMYPAAALFDHLEGTAMLIANGESFGEAQKRADLFLEIIESGPRRSTVMPAGKCGRSDLRLSPDEPTLRKILISARHWLRSDSVSHIHVVRHSQRPHAERQALREFLANAEDGTVQAMFTHEGSAYMVTSWDALIRTEGRRLRSTLAFVAGTEDDIKVQRSVVEEAKERLARFCADKALPAVRHETPTPSARRVTFEGTLSDESSAIDALVGLLPSQCLTGSPHDRALDFIDANEEILRSLYGGAFGTMDSSRSAFSTVQRVATAADGSLGTTVGLDLTEELDDDEVFERFETLIREAHPQTD